MRFQYYESKIYQNSPKGVISLFDFVQLHRDSAQLPLFEAIRIESNPDKRSSLKEKLLHFTPCVMVKDRRAYESIESFTGIAMLDFDKLPDENYADEFRDYLFNEYKSVFLSYKSASGKGVRCFVRIPVCKDVSEFKSYFYGIGYRMEYYNGFDIAPQNAVLPLFQSYDPELRYKSYNEAMEWRHKAYKVNDFESKEVKPKPYKLKIDNTGKDAEICLKSIRTMIDRIADNGYPQVRSAGLIAGGYVGAGYLSFYEAESFMHQLISNNSYLQKSLKNYITCSTWAIKEGTRKPIYRDE